MGRAGLYRRFWQLEVNLGEVALGHSTQAAPAARDQLTVAVSSYSGGGTGTGAPRHPEDSRPGARSRCRENTAGERA